MNLETFKTAIKKETNYLDFATSLYSINNNFFIGVDDCIHDESQEDKVVIQQYFFNAKFHGEYYRFSVTAKSLNQNEEWGTLSFIESVDTSDLMDSFEEAIENKYWVYLKEFCKR